MTGLAVELHSGGQTAVDLGPRLSDQAITELLLYHERCASKIPVLNKLEDERGGDLIGKVGHAHIKVRQLLSLNDVTHVDLEL